MLKVDQPYVFNREDTSYGPIARSHLEHICNLDIDTNPRFVRQTNIICTIGESCDSLEILTEMIKKGMSIARLNLTLGTYKYHGEVIKKIRAAEKDTGKCVAIAVDITSPTVRTGLINGDVDGTVRLEEGSFITLTTEEEYKTKSDDKMLWLDNAYFKNVILAMNKGDRVFIDDGALIVIVREKMIDSARCLIEQGGVLGSSKRCQLPRPATYKYAVMEKYRQSILFGVENEVDFIFASFIESGEDIKRIRSVMGAIGRNIMVIAKIETKTAAKSLDSILDAADGIMIARADMNVELPAEKIFVVQKSLIARCLKAQKPVLVGGQMLESMRTKPRPTRAEAGDVANAVLDAADGLVLRVETAKGQYPVEAVSVMHDICREAEAGFFHDKLFLELKRVRLAMAVCDPTQTTAVSAVEAAHKAHAAAILIVTTTGRSAHAISSFRPRCPVLTVTRRAATARQCHLFRGLYPIIYDEEKLEDWSEDMDCRINYALGWARERGILHAGDRIVIVTGWVAGHGTTNTVRIFELPGDKKKELHIVRSAQALIDCQK